MLELNNSGELQRLFPQVSQKKLSQLLLLCTCMLAVQSTNLSKCAKRMSKIIGKPLKFETAYSRLLRFFQTGRVDLILRGICLLVIKTLCRNENCYLLLDRTNWEIGNRKINLLVIGLLYKDVLIPLVWKDLEKKGNSSGAERLKLIDQLLKWWKYSKVPLPQLYIAGDREFIGFSWLRGLEKRKIKFVMRIRANSKIELWYRGKIKDRKLGLQIIRRYLSWTGLESVEAVLKSEYIVKVSVFENESTRLKAEYIYVMTNMEQIPKAAIFYRKRYKIEVCFKHLKSSGFNLEDLQVQGGHKVDLMFGALSVLYLMAVQKGIVHFENEAQKMNIYKHKNRAGDSFTAPAKSIFAKGCEILFENVFFFNEFCIELYRVSMWVAKKINPLQYDDYISPKTIVH